MGFIAGAELQGRLPQPTAVTISEAQLRINAAIARIAESHAPDPAPENDITLEMVEELAYAKALKLHYIKGEAEIDTGPLDEDIERVEKRFEAYDAIHSTEEEQAIEAPKAFVTDVPW